MSSIIKVDQIQSDTGTVNLASNLAFSSAFSMSGPVTLNSPTIATPTMTGQAVIPSINLTSGQIVFPATQNPSADANTLDDYEEGTWTPAWNFSTSGSATIVVDFAVYTKIGNLVSIGLRINTSAISSPVGNATITGLPFPAFAGEAAGSIGRAFRFTTSMPNLKAHVSVSTIIFNKQATDQTVTTQLLGSDFEGGTSNIMALSFTYRTS